MTAILNLIEMDNKKHNWRSFFPSEKKIESKAWKNSSHQYMFEQAQC